MNIRKPVLLILASIISFCVAAQKLDWAISIGDSNGDSGTKNVLDADGNIYLTGAFQGKVDFDPGPGTFYLQSKGLTDVFFAKYTEEGQFVWAKNVGGLYWDFAHDIDLDTMGNILITGVYRNTSDFDPGPATVNLSSNGWYNIYMAKYDNDGNYIWAHGFGSASNDLGRSIKTDPSGNVYIAGYLRGQADIDPSEEVHDLSSNGENDIFFAKYSPAGSLIWGYSFGNSKWDSAMGLETDTSGNVYISGFFQNTVDFDPSENINELETSGNGDLFFAKYDSSGNYQWAKAIGGAHGEAGNVIKVDPSGNIILSGYFGSGGGPVDFDPGEGEALLQCLGHFDAFVAKYDHEGNYQWAKQIGGSGFDNGLAIDTDQKGNLFLAGSFQNSVDIDPGFGDLIINSEGDYDGFLLQLNPEGDYVWHKQFGSLGWETIQGISADTSGSIFISGGFEGTIDMGIDSISDPIISNGDTDVMLARYQIPSKASYTEISLCSGLVHEFPDGLTSDSSMVHYISYDSGNDCDSLAVYALKVDTFYYDEKQIQICEGDSYEFPDGSVSEEEIIHTINYEALDGCDSIIVFEISILPNNETTEIVQICDGDVYEFPDGTLGENSMNHTSILLNQYGCDSIIVTGLTVLPGFEEYSISELCSGESIVLPDGGICEGDTIHYYKLLSKDGCDSIIITEVDVIDIELGIYQNGSQLVAETTADSILWIDCENMEYVTDVHALVFSPGSEGIYAAVAFESACSLMSECLNFSFSSTQGNFEENLIKLFPNPASDIVYVQSEIKGNINIYDIHGNLCSHFRMENVIMGIDVSALTPGVYTMRIEHESLYAHSHFKFIKI